LHIFVDPAQTKNVFKVKNNLRFKGPYNMYAAYISITSKVVGAIDEYNHYCELSVRDSESDAWKCVDLPPETFAKGPIDIYDFRVLDTFVNVQGSDTVQRNYFLARQPVPGVGGWISWYEYNTKQVFVTFVDRCLYHLIGGVNVVLICADSSGIVNSLVILKKQCKCLSHVYKNQ
jgi:hypothetical protein